MRFVPLALLLISTTALADMPAGGFAGARAPRIMEEPPERPLPIQRVATPAPEIAAHGKTLEGSWSCKGTILNGDGSSRPMVATVKSNVDLAGGWVQSALVENGVAQMTEYRTFDGTSKQWTRLRMMATSGYAMQTSLGEANGQWQWMGTETSPIGTTNIRDFEQMTNATTMHLWGDALLGGTWQKRYDTTCTKDAPPPAPPLPKKK